MPDMMRHYATRGCYERCYRDRVRDMTKTKERYRFSHRSLDGLTYYWESRTREQGESRVEQIRCNVDWFWKPLPR